MALKIITFIFVISLAYSIPASTQIKDVPFNMNEVIDRVNNHRQVKSRIPNSEFQEFDQGEFLIDTCIVYGTARYWQEHPSIAFDGTNYLVVWQDCRNGPTNIYFTRVSQSGQILDPSGIKISIVGELPSVAFDGINYLVVWQDERNAYTDIYGTRVSQNGEVLDPNGIPISTAWVNQDYPAIAFDGNNYLVVWQDHRRGYYNIFGARVTPNGQVLEPDGIHLSLVPSTQAAPSVAFDGDNYLVVWQDNRNYQTSNSDIYGTRVTPTGQVLDSIAIPITTKSGTQGSPSVAFGNNNYFVVWQDNCNSYTQYDIYGTQVSKNGHIFENPNIPISIATGNQESPSIIFYDTMYLVVWEDRRNGIESDIYGARVLQNGQMLDTTGIFISTAPNTGFSWWSPSVANDGNSYLVVWQGDWDNTDIYGARISQNGQLLDTNGILISNVANFQLAPSVAFDGSNYLVVWEDGRFYNNSCDIYGARVDQFGSILDPNSIAISTRENFQLAPVVCFDGFNFLVVWYDVNDNDIYGTRITTTGTILDTIGFPISTAINSQENPSVAFDGLNYLVVWKDERNDYSDIYGARVSQTGTVLDPDAIAISTATNDQLNPAVAFDGINYLVVWEDIRNGSHDIYGARVTQAGTVLDLNGIPICTRSNWLTSPSIAFDGTNYLVVWGIISAGRIYDIFGTRINQSGFVFNPNGFPISTAPSHQSSPSIAFDGNNYLVVWIDQRNGSYDIYGAKVDTTDNVISSFCVARQSGDPSFPVLAHGLGDEFLITYSGWADTINHHPVNNMRIWGKLSSSIGIDEKNSRVKMQSAKLLEVYPNPARSFLAVRLPFSADRQTLKVFDVAGKMIKEIETLRSAQNFRERKGYNYDEAKISLKGINPGIYFLRVGKETKKFIVAK